MRAQAAASLTTRGSFSTGSTAGAGDWARAIGETSPPIMARQVARQVRARVMTGAPVNGAWSLRPRSQNKGSERRVVAPHRALTAVFGGLDRGGDAPALGGLGGLGFGLGGPGRPRAWVISSGRAATSQGMRPVSKKPS